MECSCCEEKIKECNGCQEKFKKGHTVYCDGYNHYCSIECSDLEEGEVE